QRVHEPIRQPALRRHELDVLTATRIDAKVRTAESGGDLVGIQASRVDHGSRVNVFGRRRDLDRRLAWLGVSQLGSWKDDRAMCPGWPRGRLDERLRLENPGVR